MNKSKATHSAKVKTFQFYLQLIVIFLFTINLFTSDRQFRHGHIYNIQAFKTTWVNSPAYQNHTELVS